MGQFIQDGARIMFETVLEIEDSSAEVILKEEDVDVKETGNFTIYLIFWPKSNTKPKNRHSAICNLQFEPHADGVSGPGGDVLLF